MAQSFLNRLARPGQLVSQYPGEGAPTIIELPRRADGPAPPTYTEEMRQSLGPLCAFSKGIRRVTWRHVGGTFEAEWKPRQVAGIEGVEIGRLGRTDDNQAYQLALVFRHATEALLMRLDANGVDSLPVAVPTIWALAPTAERWRLATSSMVSFELTSVGPASRATLKIICSARWALVIGWASNLLPYLGQLRSNGPGLLRI
jgi:hypothetical protein